LPWLNLTRFLCPALQPVQGSLDPAQPAGVSKILSSPSASGGAGGPGARAKPPAMKGELARDFGPHGTLGFPVCSWHIAVAPPARLGLPLSPAPSYGLGETGQQRAAVGPWGGWHRGEGYRGLSRAGLGALSLGLGCPAQGLGGSHWVWGAQSGAQGAMTRIWGTQPGFGVPCLGLRVPYSESGGGSACGSGCPAQNLRCSAWVWGDSLGLEYPAQGLGCSARVWRAQPGFGGLSQGSGCPAQNLGSSAWGLGCPARGSGCPTQNLGSSAWVWEGSAWGSGCHAQDLGCSAWGSGCHAQDLGCSAWVWGALPRFGWLSPVLWMPCLGSGGLSLELQCLAGIWGALPRVWGAQPGTGVLSPGLKVLNLGLRVSA